VVAVAVAAAAAAAAAEAIYSLQSQCYGGIYKVVGYKVIVMIHSLKGIELFRDIIIDYAKWTSLIVITSGHSLIDNNNG
jgi:hypothetical protein